MEERTFPMIPPNAGSPVETRGLDKDTGVLKLWGHWREIARLASLGYKQAEICRMLNLSPTTVWLALNRNQLVKDRIAYLQGKRDASTMDISKRLKAMQPVALEVLERVLLDEEEGEVTPKLKVDVAKTVLDRGGNGAVTKHEHIGALLTFEDLKEIHERAAQLRSGQVSPSPSENNEKSIKETEYEEVS